MNVADELNQYSRRWETLTGHKPGAMPITEKEGFELMRMLSEMPSKPCPNSEGVYTFNGIDLYFVPDAKARRDRIIKQ